VLVTSDIAVFDWGENCLLVTDRFLSFPYRMFSCFTNLLLSKECSWSADGGFLFKETTGATVVTFADVGSFVWKDEREE